ncbi:oligosaccharide flippase family protein [Bradyrhizobium sp. KBS0727]|uniref:lipopolysaccharide biosynthesis protein n=1 Tax=unclassified Bradyrhizobium TaxID=2631580 RepID=UPI00110D89FD|nr:MULTISPECIES: oligosaccharide flippase family protein [unclassified Bradyrhizobium]QDW39796.1 oligosaccharide flippase family protein [Bradyrhizobium sp. KBS0725]QDW46399.1 oligosaccharide flippase family protein [Bradyrhizobium sp. KBS0727]
MKVLRSGAIYVVANLLSAAIPFLLLPILTRALGPDEYGHIVGFALLVTLCLTLSGLNAHAALGVIWFRQPRDEMPSYVGAALLLALLSTAVVALGVGIVLRTWPGLGSGLMPVWGIVAALTAGANVILQCRLVLWQSQQKALQSATLQLIASALNVGLSLAAVFLLGWGGAGRNAGIAVSAGLLACAAIYLFMAGDEVRWSARRDQVKMLLAFGLPLIFHTLAGVLLGTADRWIISIQLGSGSLGVYGAGAQLGMTMAILADAFVKAYGPWMYEKLASTKAVDKHYAVGAIYAMIPAFLCGAAVLWIILHFASSILLGPRFQDAVPLLPWFMLGGAFTGVYVCTSVLFFYSGRTALLSSVTLPSAILGTMFTWILVARYGVVGAAMGYSFTQALLALFVGGFAVKSFDLPWGEGRKAIEVWSHRALGYTARQPV